MKNKLFYPAVFHTAEEGGFWVSFPDIPECLTEGDDMEKAYEMAVEALGLSLTYMEEHREAVPAASDFSTIELQDGEHLVIVEFDMAAYRKRHRSKAVKKTLSIPEWMNEEANALGLNFSQILQEALLAKLQAH